MTDNKTHWDNHEKMMASAYANIASSFSQIKSYMQNHLKTVRTGGGIIADGDIEEVLQQLSLMFNKNLHNVSQIRVNFSMEKLPSQKPTSVTPTENNQNNDMKTENRNRNVVRLTESKLKQIIAEELKKALMEQQQFSSLREFMNDYYDNDSSCSSALELLMDDSYIQKQGWKRVFHEGYGEGVCSPTESIVAVFDVDDVPKYHSYGLYRYNPRAWKDTDGDGWDRIYAGDNGEDFEVEPISR